MLACACACRAVPASVRVSASLLCVCLRAPSLCQPSRTPTHPPTYPPTHPPMQEADFTCDDMILAKAKAKEVVMA